MLGYVSGLRWIQPEMEPETLLRTTFVIHVCDAVMCRLFAVNNGYPRNLWTFLGFIFGLWGVAVMILLPNRLPPKSENDEAK